MLKRASIGASTLLLAIVAMAGTRADACDRGCGCGGCSYPPYLLPLYFSNPVKSSFVYYPSYRRWKHGRKIYYRRAPIYRAW